MRFLQTFALLCALVVVCSADDFADRLYRAGQKAEKAGDKLHAFLLYSQAAALQPLNAEFAMRKSAMQADAAMSASSRTDTGPMLTAEGSERVEINAEPLTDSEMLEARLARPPIRLKRSDEIKSFDLNGDPQTVIEKVMASYGLMVAFERDYEVPKPFRFRVENLRFEEVLRLLETLSGSFFVPMNERVALVVHDTPQKRTEMSPAMSIAIPIPERISVQDAQEMMQAVQSTLEIRKFSLDPVKRVVYMRDQVPKIVAARSMFTDLSRLRAQVAVDVEFVEVTKTSSLGYGLELPTSYSLVNFGTFMHNDLNPGIPPGFTKFLTFGGGATFFGIGIMASSLLALFTSNNQATIIFKTEVVALDGLPTTLHVGEKYPIVTASYTGGNTNTVPGGLSSGLIAPPTVNFEDIGLSLKVTPSVHDQGEVSIEISSEFKAVGPPSAQGLPAIMNRKYEGKVRLKSDETAIVAGLVTTMDSDTRTGIYGLASVPWIGRVLRSNMLNHNSSQVLLVLKPHVMDVPPWEYGSKPIWLGTETKPLSLF